MKLKIILIVIIALLAGNLASAELNLAQRLSGRILLQVESAGEAWYVNPADGKRYFLGSPDDAFAIMRRLSLGINNTDFNKISSDKNLTARVRGRIILRVQSAGEAYYVSPMDGQKYYLGRPNDALNVMKRLALGITNADLAPIPAGQLELPKTADSSVVSPKTNPPASSQQSLLEQAAAAVRNNDASKTQSYFTSSLRPAVTYTLSALNADSRLLLANILSGAKLTGQTDTKKTYSTTAHFFLGGYDIPLHFYVQKQPDGAWLMTNL